MAASCLTAGGLRGVYAAIGVTVDGRKDVLGLWAGSGGEGAKFWMSFLVDLKNRGIGDVFFVVCDGLKGLPDTIEAVWPQAMVQTCIIHWSRQETTCCFPMVSSLDWRGGSGGSAYSTGRAA